MGNLQSKTDWLSSTARQLPGMIKTTWKQVLEKPNPSDVNISLEKTKVDFAHYTPVLTGMTSPVAFVDPGQGGVLYAVDQNGMIYRYAPSLAQGATEVRVDPSVGTVYKRPDGDVVEPPLLDLRQILPALSPISEERGLLQMVFHPIDKRIFYLYYTVPPVIGGDHNCDVVLEEWWIDGGEGGAPFPGRQLFRWPHPDANHFGSPIGFGPDNYLYLATGDGGNAGDPHGAIGNAQNPDSVWGKIFEINVLVNPVEFRLRSVGYRNPWRGSFTAEGFPIVGDVGQNEYEGIHVDKGAQNHGWRALENGHVYDPELYEELKSAGIIFTEPVYWYGRSLGRAVIGGYQVNAWGDYLFGDYTGSPYADNIFLIKDEVLTLQDRPKDRAKFLHSFARDRHGILYGLFNNVLGVTGETGVVYRIQIIEY